MSKINHKKLAKRLVLNAIKNYYEMNLFIVDDT